MDPSPKTPIDGTETPAHAVERLHAGGYAHDFVADRFGLRDVATGLLHAPETLVIDEVVRYEGQSDPGDETIIYALRDKDGRVRGVYSAAYGPAADPLDAEIMSRLTAA